MKAAIPARFQRLMKTTRRIGKSLARSTAWPLRCSLALSLAACQSAIVPPVMVAGDAPGPYLHLHDAAGPCVGTARHAVYTYADGRTVPGCWVVRGGSVVVVFFDGDMGSLPVTAFRLQEGA